MTEILVTTEEMDLLMSTVNSYDCDFETIKAEVSEIPNNRPYRRVSLAWKYCPKCNTNLHFFKRMGFMYAGYCPSCKIIGDNSFSREAAGQYLILKVLNYRN